MRTLHTNSRNYQEPFVLVQIQNNTKNSFVGVDSFKVLKKITMFGSILNKSLTYANQFQDTDNTVLSILIPFQNISINAQDRIIYNNNQYVVSECNKNYYNNAEIAIKAVFEKTVPNLNAVSVLNCVLNSKLI